MLTLIATDLPRFMVCNAFPSMPQHTPFNTNDEMRIEGTAVHWFIEQVHKNGIKPEEMVNRKAPNGVFITEEMVEYSEAYIAAIRGKGVVECDTSYGDDQHYRINGRADHIEFDSNTATLYVSDFKYGWGITEPENNWTLISHALGYIIKNLGGVTPANIVFRIFQPRPHHPLGKIRECYIEGNELQALFSELIIALCNTVKQLKTSDYCRKCPALASCPAAIKANMNAIDVSETPFIADVDDKTLGILLDQFERAVKMLEATHGAYSERALHRLKAGAHIPGYIAEKDMTNEQWKSGITVETARALIGRDLGKKQLITPKQALKAGVPDYVVDSLCERREKGIKLAKLDADKAAKKILKNQPKGA